MRVDPYADFTSKVQRLLAELPWQPWMDQFLEDLERHGGNVSAAIELSPVCRDTAYRYRRRNRKFAQRWQAVTGRSE